MDNKKLLTAAGLALIKWIEEGKIVAPGPPGLVDLVRAVALLCGSNSFENNEPVRSIARDIGEHDHYVFVLVDGMGMNLLPRFPENGFLSSHLLREISAVFPSTTAAALTVLATGRQPAENGITGWFTHLPGFDVTSLPLRHVDRGKEGNLAKRRIHTVDIIPSNPIFRDFNRQVTIFHHKKIAEGQYARWAADGKRIKRFGDVNRTINRISRRIKRAAAPSYTYLYLSQLDHESHKHGWDSDTVNDVLRDIDEQLSLLKESVGSRAKIIVTADHGHINVPQEKHMELQHDDSLLRLLECPPSGESRVPIYHGRSGQERALADELSERWGEGFIFITPDDVEATNLYGDAPLHSLTRSRLGTYIGLSADPSAIEYIPKGKTSVGHIGMHGGLSAEEMRVPLILA